MANLNNHDFNLLERLVSSNQNQTGEFILKYLEHEYDEIIETDDYIIGIGQIPIALVAHMDTVFEDDNLDRGELFYDNKRDVLWNPNGAGFDDKAGIFSILKIIENGFLPHVIFTTNEEIGSLGAEILANDMPNMPFEDLKYIIELDRANYNDCVFYNCMNYKFEDYISSFGFETKMGVRSDICKICPKWRIAGVNLSIGYRNQHTEYEVLNVDALFSTISKVKDMLNDAENLKEHFEYELVLSDF